MILIVLSSVLVGAVLKLCSHLGCGNGDNSRLNFYRDRPDVIRESEAVRLRMR